MSGTDWNLVPDTFSTPDQYKAIVKHLKKDGVTIKAYVGRKYVIGPHTYSRIKCGELVMGVKGLELPPD